MEVGDVCQCKHRQAQSTEQSGGVCVDLHTPRGGGSLVSPAQLSWSFPSATPGTGVFDQLILPGMKEQEAGIGLAEEGVRRDTRNQLPPQGNTSCSPIPPDTFLPPCSPEETEREG